MSSFLTGISDYIPTVNLDNLKSTVSGGMKSKLATLLPKLKTLASNSYIKSNNFWQMMSFDPDMLSIDSFKTYIAESKLASIYGLIDSSSIGDFNDSVAHFFSAFGQAETLWPGSFAETTGRSFVITTFSGKVIKLFLGDNSPVDYPDIWCLEDGMAPGTSLRLITKVGVGPNPYPPYTEFEYRLKNYVRTYDGSYYSLVDIVEEQRENAELEHALQELSEACLQFDDGGSTILSLISNYVLSPFNSVKDLAKRIKAGWIGGSLYGVIRVILDYFLAPSYVSTDDDGNLIFTSNADYIPQTYVAGILSIITGVASAVASAIAAIFNVVAGVIVSIIGQVVNQFINAITYDYTTYTVASLVDDYRVDYPIAPYGLGARLIPDISAVTHAFDPIADSFNKKGVFGLHVPGGVVLMTWVDGHIRQEFHPDLVDRRAFLTTGIISYIPPTGTPYVTVDFRYNRDEIYQYIDSIPQSNVVLENQSNGVLSELNSEILSEIIATNMLIFYYWLFCDDLHGEKLTFVATYNSLPDPLTNVYLGTTINDPKLTFATNNETKTMIECFGYLAIYTYWKWSGADSNPIWEDMAIFASSANVLWGLDSQVLAFTGSDQHVTRITLSSVTCPTLALLSDILYAGQSTPNCIYGAPYLCSNNMRYGMLTPKYDKSSFWINLVGTMILTAAVAAITVIVSMKVKRSISRKRAQLKGSVENAWSDLTKNPDAEHAEIYRSAARKNNMFAKLFGGSTYSYSDYWDSNASKTGVFSSVVSDLVSSESDSNAESMSTSGYGPNILRKITGVIDE